VDAYEKGIYSILGCNADALKQFFRGERSSYWYDMLWAELRVNLDDGFIKSNILGRV